MENMKEKLIYVDGVRGFYIFLFQILERKGKRERERSYCNILRNNSLILAILINFSNMMEINLF